MLSLWFWLEEWFTDVPSLRAVVGRAMATAIVSVIVLFATGIAFGLSGKTVAGCATGTIIGLFAWAGWAGSKIGIRYRERMYGPPPPSERPGAEARKNSQG